MKISPTCTFNPEPSADTLDKLVSAAVNHSFTIDLTGDVPTAYYDREKGIAFIQRIFEFVVTQLTGVPYNEEPEPMKLHTPKQMIELLIDEAYERLDDPDPTLENDAAQLRYIARLEDALRFEEERSQ